MTEREIDAAIEIIDPRWTVNEPTVQAAIKATLVAAGRTRRNVELSVTLADDPMVHALNRDYRGVDKPTNVLSFALEEGEQPPLILGQPDALGDVFLAYETVEREASEQGKSIEDHTIHLIIHGVLHLLGYDHQDEESAAVMERHEREILSTFGVRDPYGDGDLVD